VNGRGSHRRPRSVGSWLVRGIAAALALGLLSAGLVAAPHLREASSALAAAPAVELRAAHGASYVPALAGKRPLFILALGSDARPGQVVSRERADSIHIIGVNPAKRRATILGFPRDAWVFIPGFGHSKISNAMAFGGPGLMIRTLEGLTGIRFDFYMLTSFDGLQRMVDAVGGLTVDVPYGMNDRPSHAHLKAGVQRLRGWQALALARNRKDTPNGDFSRSLNQGRLISSALSQLRKEFQESPARLLKYVVTGWRNVATDLSFATLFDLAMAATQVPPWNVNNLVVPGSSGFVGAASVVFLASRGRALYADLRADGVIT
jgi:polyisoprenyl-teichoic acid--peptidoglycan teichoic acid transferase